MLDKKDVKLMEKLIDNSITNDEYQELLHRALHNEGFASGEILVREYIPPSQIKAPDLNEESKGLWYYINRKKKLGIKSTPKNSKEYKAAVKAGKGLSNEGIDKIKYTEPNFEYEWKEALRYPEFEEMGKEEWIKTAEKGNIINYSQIKDNLGNVNLDFKKLEEPKKKRFISAFNKGIIEMPIAVKFSDNDYDLVAGNTRISGLVKNGIDPKIWIVDISNIQEGIDDPVEPGILKKRLGKLSCTRVKAEKAKLKDKGTHYAKALQRYINYHC